MGDGLKAESLAALLQHRLSACGSHAADADCANGQQCIKIANSACRLDLNLCRRMLAHQFEIGKRCAAGRISCGSLYPIGADLCADLAQADFGIIVEIRILKDDFDLCSACMNQVSKCGK